MKLCTRIRLENGLPVQIMDVSFVPDDHQFGPSGDGTELHYEGESRLDVPAERCALCDRPAVGSAFVVYVSNNSEIRLCHSSVRDCYHRWCAWGQRPGQVPDGMPGKVGAER